LKIFGLNSLNNSLISKLSFPIEISKMGSVQINLKFCINKFGDFSDSLLILSDDPVKSKFILPINAFVENYFSILDNEESDKYTEFGKWNTSVAKAHGNSSRYSTLNQNPLSYAEFKTKLSKDGKYNLYEIVPVTVNACEKVKYIINISNINIDTFYLNQNESSGSWKLISTYFLPKDVEITIKVIDTGEGTPGFVLRTDAFKFQLVEELTDISDDLNQLKKLQYKLYQNYPNPFNPSTTIKYSIPVTTTALLREVGGVFISLKIYDILGNEVSTLVNENKTPGIYEVKFDGSKLVSGIYFYRIQIDASTNPVTSFTKSMKMILLK